jgi:hypothetical protein
MTAIMDASPTAAVAERPVPRPHVEAPNSWANAAVRAHALLSQTMPDEEIDELVEAAVPFHRTICLPPFLFG